MLNKLCIVLASYFFLAYHCTAPMTMKISCRTYFGKKNKGDLRCNYELSDRVLQFQLPSNKKAEPVYPQLFEVGASPNSSETIIVLICWEVKENAFYTTCKNDAIIKKQVQVVEFKDKSQTVEAVFSIELDAPYVFKKVGYFKYKPSIVHGKRIIVVPEFLLAEKPTVALQSFALYRLNFDNKYYPIEVQPVFMHHYLEKELAIHFREASQRSFTPAKQIYNKKEFSPVVHLSSKNDPIPFDGIQSIETDPEKLGARLPSDLFDPSLIRFECRLLGPDSARNKPDPTKIELKDLKGQFEFLQLSFFKADPNGLPGNFFGLVLEPVDGVLHFDINVFDAAKINSVNIVQTSELKTLDQNLRFRSSADLFPGVGTQKSFEDGKRREWKIELLDNRKQANLRVFLWEFAPPAPELWLPPPKKDFNGQIIFAKTYEGPFKLDCAEAPAALASDSTKEICTLRAGDDSVIDSILNKTKPNSDFCVLEGTITELEKKCFESSNSELGKLRALI